jgi:beta-phosphoglucomutase-like phosphatase (HAD superfamily)
LVKAVESVIFDMDGTLVDAREWHFRSLNEALQIFGEEITVEEHLSRFDGLPTKVKLATLTELGRIPKNIHGIVSAVKQDRTLREVAKNCFPKVEHLLLMSWLRAREIPIAVATNSIRATAEIMLKSSGVLGFIDCLVTNEDVRRAKPDPEIYLVACERLGVSPENTLVVEDHPYGVEAAEKAGCDVIQVSGPWEVTTKLIESHIMMNGRGI